MKILLLTDRMDAGGAETHIAQLARGLRKMGCDVTLLSGGGALADELEAEGIRQICAPLPSHSPFLLWKLRRRIRRLVRDEGFDVLHAHARVPAILIHGCERLGAAEIVTVHAHFYTNPILSRLCRWGKYTVAVSEDLRAYVCQTYRVPAERVRVIHNGIDCERFSPAPAALPHAPRILFASRLDADCSLGAVLLCRLAPTLCLQFPGAEIEIAGGGSEYERIRELAKEANRALGREAVRLCGWVHDMPALLRQQDIFVGVSRAAMEAAACGCAVILCGNEGYFGILERANARAATLTNFCARGCPAPNEDRLRNDLGRLLEDPALRKEYGKEGREWICGNFGAEVMCRETLALYHRARPVKQTVTVTVGGYFGCGNLGDDAILLGLLEELRAASPNVRVVALTGDPHRDSRRFGVHCVSRKNPFSILWALSGSHAFLCGGGSLLQNITSGRSLSYYLMLLRVANAMGLPTLLCAAGIGPLVGERVTKKVTRTLARCRYIGLRDAESFRLLGALGVDAGKLHMGADPAFFMPLPPVGRSLSVLQSAGVPSTQKCLCIVLRGGKSAELTRAILLTAARLICRRHGLSPLFLLFDGRRDGSDTRWAQVQSEGYLAVCREPADAAAVISSCCAVLSMRLHALILATAVGAPAVGVAADPRDNKIAAFAGEAGQDFIPPERLNVASVAEALERAIADRRTRRSLLLDCAADLRKSARREVANIAEIVSTLHENKSCNALY